MPQLKVPSADLALKPLVGQFIVTTLDCQIIVSQALGFTRNRGLDFSPIVAISGRGPRGGLVQGIDYVDYGQYTTPRRDFIRRRADVLAAEGTLAEAVRMAYTFFESEPAEEVPAA